VPGEKVAAQFEEKGQAAVEIVVGEEEAGAPGLEEKKDQRRDEKIPAQEPAPPGFSVASPAVRRDHPPEY
jgi:hypothetical protein